MADQTNTSAQAQAQAAGATGAAALTLKWTSLTVNAVTKWLEAAGSGEPRVNVIDANGVVLRDKSGQRVLYGEGGARDKLACYLVHLRMENDPRVIGENGKYYSRVKGACKAEGTPEDVFAGVKTDTANTVKTVEVVKQVDHANLTDAVTALIAKLDAEAAKAESSVTGARLGDAEAAAKLLNDHVALLQTKLAEEEEQAELNRIIAEEEAALKEEARKRAQKRIADAKAKAAGTPTKVKPA